jgi:PAS domain S-box-containing protein
VTARAYETLAPRLAAALAGEPQFFESRLLYADGIERDIEGSIAPDIDADGVVQGAIGMTLDISARKDADRALAASELRYRSIFDAAHVSILRTQISDGHPIDANARCAEMMGYDSKEDLLANFSGVDHWPSPEARREWIAQGLEGGLAGNREITLRRRDGATIWLRTSATFHPDANCVDVVSIDITENKEQESAIIAAREQAQLANRAKSEFLAHFSHELRTPLNAVIGFSEIMQQEIYGPLGDRHYREYADDIHHSGQLLLALINDILDLARIESGKQERDEQVFDAREVVEECARLLRARAAAKDVEIELQQPAEAPRLRADERQLRQILLNLLTNAVKFTRANTTVCVRTEICAHGDYHFHVSDHGEGMSAQDIVRVQEPFIRLDGAHASTEEGTGLGLAITKSLAESHGGRLRLESELGVGTTATVSFPRDRVVAAAA